MKGNSVLFDNTFEVKNFDVVYKNYCISVFLIFYFYMNILSLSKVLMFVEKNITAKIELN